MFVMTKLEQTAMKVKSAAKEDVRRRCALECGVGGGSCARGVVQYLSVIRAELPQIVFPERFQLALSPHMVARGLRVDKCRVMTSKKLPLWLTFENATPGADPIMIL